MSGATANERLARIEALLEAKSDRDADWQDKTDAQLTKIEQRVTGAEVAHQQLVNRGAGILIGVSAVFSIIGAVFYEKLHDAAMWFLGVAK